MVKIATKDVLKNLLKNNLMATVCTLYKVTYRPAVYNLAFWYTSTRESRVLLRWGKALLHELEV